MGSCGDEYHVSNHFTIGTLGTRGVTGCGFLMPGPAQVSTSHFQEEGTGCWQCCPGKVEGTARQTECWFGSHLGRGWATGSLLERATNLSEEGLFVTLKWAWPTTERESCFRRETKISNNLGFSHHPGASTGERSHKSPFCLFVLFLEFAIVGFPKSSH